MSYTPVPDELWPGMVFDSIWGIVRLDHRVPGDGTKWRVLDYSHGNGHWINDESTIEPDDLNSRIVELE